MLFFILFLSKVLYPIINKVDGLLDVVTPIFRDLIDDSVVRKGKQ